jgi:hypothetical protein
MAQNFKHNKKRNTGLVYEFLVRRLSHAMLEGDKSGQKTVLGIIQKYYDPETGPLAEERELFEVVRNTRGVSESVARQVIGEVQKHARVMDGRRLDIKKSNLIKEINYAFGKSFWDDHRIPDYRLLASIQMVVDASRGDATLTESVSKFQLEEGLVQYMTSKGGQKMVQMSQGEVDALVMKMVAKRFEEKYSKSLSPAQKTLLEKYIRYQVTGDSKPLFKVINEQANRIHDSLDAARTMQEVISDPMMAKKLDEAIARWDEMNKSGFQKLDESVEEIMMFQKLVEEI